MVFLLTCRRHCLSVASLLPRLRLRVDPNHPLPTPARLALIEEYKQSDHYRLFSDSFYHDIAFDGQRGLLAWAELVKGPFSSQTSEIILGAAAEGARTEILIDCIYKGHHIHNGHLEYICNADGGASCLRELLLPPTSISTIGSLNLSLSIFTGDLELIKQLIFDTNNNSFVFEFSSFEIPRSFRLGISARNWTPALLHLFQQYKSPLTAHIWAFLCLSDRLDLIKLALELEPASELSTQFEAILLNAAAGGALQTLQWAVGRTPPSRWTPDLIEKIAKEATTNFQIGVLKWLDQFGIAQFGSNLLSALVSNYAQTEPPEAIQVLEFLLDRTPSPPNGLLGTAIKRGFSVPFLSTLIERLQLVPTSADFIEAASFDRLEVLYLLDHLGVAWDPYAAIDACMRRQHSHASHWIMLPIPLRALRFVVQQKGIRPTAAHCEHAASSNMDAGKLIRLLHDFGAPFNSADVFLPAFKNQRIPSLRALFGLGYHIPAADLGTCWKLAEKPPLRPGQVLPPDYYTGESIYTLFVNNVSRDEMRRALLLHRDAPWPPVSPTKSAVTVDKSARSVVSLKVTRDSTKQ